jgi:hypothetical protein
MFQHNQDRVLQNLVLGIDGPRGAAQRSFIVQTSTCAALIGLGTVKALDTYSIVTTLKPRIEAITS